VELLRGRIAKAIACTPKLTKLGAEFFPGEKPRQASGALPIWIIEHIFKTYARGSLFLQEWPHHAPSF